MKICGVILSGGQEMEEDLSSKIHLIGTTVVAGS